MRAIDMRHLGREKVICCWEVDGVLVDPGPQSTEATLLAALGDREPRAPSCSPTSTSTTPARRARWCAAGPACPVYVHERGAPHLADPARLVASAARLYGGERGAARLWGEVVPVPEANLHVLRGGETVLGDFRVEYTPGHASHHVCYLHEPSGTAFVGDVAGVRIPPAELRDRADAAARHRRRGVGARASTSIEGWAPEALALTHFGRVDDVGPHLRRVRDAAARAGRARRRARRRRRSTPGIARSGSPSTRPSWRRRTRRRRRRSTCTWACGAIWTSARRLAAVPRNRAAWSACGLPARWPRPSSCRASPGPDSEPGRALAGDRPQRRPQHVRPRGATRSRATSRACRVDKGYAMADLIHNQRPGHGVGGPEGAGGALLGAAQRRRASRWPRSSRAERAGRRASRARMPPA